MNASNSHMQLKSKKFNTELSSLEKEIRDIFNFLIFMYILQPINMMKRNISKQCKTERVFLYL